MRTQRKARFVWEQKPKSEKPLLILLVCVVEIADSDFLVVIVKLSWPKTLVKKWFNIKSKAEDFHADDVVFEGSHHLCPFLYI